MVYIKKIVLKLRLLDFRIPNEIQFYEQNLSK